MNFTVDRDQFEGMLARIQGVAERRHTMPVLSHALLTAGPAAGPTGTPGISLVATDLEIVVRCSLAAPVAEAGAMALPAKRLFDIAKVLPKGAVTISGRDGNFAEISAERGHFRLAGLSSKEFPEMPQKPAGAPVPVDSEAFRRLSDRVVSFAASDETRYNLAGVLFEARAGEGSVRLRAVATDGHRLALADGEIPGAEELLGGKRILVPKKGVLEVRKLADTGAGSLEISASEKFLYAGKGDAEIWVRLLEADFPDYQQVIPKENRIRASVPRDAFVMALRRVIVMAPEKILSVRLSFSGKQLEVSTTSPDVGEARDLLPVEYEGSPLRIGFNARYLQDAVAGIPEETFLFELKDETSQVIVRPKEDPSYLAIIMPMRIA